MSSEYKLPSAITADKRLLSLYNKYHSVDNMSANTPSSLPPNSTNKEAEVTYNYNPTQKIQAIEESEASLPSLSLLKGNETNKLQDYETMNFDDSDEVDSQPLTCQQRSPNRLNRDQNNNEFSNQQQNIPKSIFSIEEFALTNEQIQNGNFYNPSYQPSSSSIFTCNTENDPILQNLRKMNHKTPSTNYDSYNKKRDYIPTNRTSQSMGKGTVILIKLKNEDSSVLSNPFLVNNLIMDSEFKQLNIEDIRLNKMRNIIAVEAKNELSYEITEQMTKITKLGPFDVQCEVPNSDKFKYGVIQPISEDIDLDELKDKINNNNMIQIVKIDRLKKKLNKNWINTQSIKLTIKKGNFPDNIKIGYLKFNIRPYVNEPMQCYRCQRLGHTSKSCKARFPRCMLCGESHTKDQCDSEKKKCANCYGEHSANSKQCQIINEARKLEKLKANHKIDYETARNQMRHKTYLFQPSSFPSQKISQIPETPSQSFSHPSTSYASITAGGPRVDESSRRNRMPPTRQPSHQLHGMMQRTILKDAETQTHEEEQYKKPDEDFLRKLRNFIVDIFSTNLTKETKEAKICLADNAIKHNFGINLRKTETDKNENKSAEKRKRKNAVRSDISVSEPDSNLESEDVISDTENLWETVEKKQVKRNLRSNKKHKDTNQQ